MMAALGVVVLVGAVGLLVRLLCIIANELDREDWY